MPYFKVLFEQSNFKGSRFTEKGLKEFCVLFAPLLATLGLGLQSVGGQQADATKNGTLTDFQIMSCYAGNHERDWPNTGDRYLQENAKDSGGECGVVFEKRLPMPIPHPGQQWYPLLLIPPCLTSSFLSPCVFYFFTGCMRRDCSGAQPYTLSPGQIPF